MDMEWILSFDLIQSRKQTEREEEEYNGSHTLDTLLFKERRIEEMHLE